MNRRGWPALAALALLFLSACRGAAGRAAPLPHPTDLPSWIALGVFVIGIWWVALKILRG